MSMTYEKEQLVNRLKWFIKNYGWHETMKALREIVSPHVGWDSEFTELDNVLHRIEKTFKGKIREVTNLDRTANDHTEDKLDNPDLSPE